MVYLLATSQHGMKTEQIARELELRGLVPRRSGKPLDGKVIAAIVFKHPEVFSSWKALCPQAATQRTMRV